VARRITISGLQMVVSKDVAANERKILEGLKRAADEGADFLLTPEGSLSGYYSGFDRVQVADAVERLAAEARSLGVGLALGTCYKQIEGDLKYCYNQVRLYAPDGQYLGCHDKILRCSPLGHPGTGEMREYVEGVLRVFDWQGLRFGVLICNDLWAAPGFTTSPNPYLPWRLAQMGAKLILHSINSGSTQVFRSFHESSVELWAHTLGLPIVELNAAPVDGGPVNARSGLVGSDGSRLLSAPDAGEQFFTGALEIE
jgi:predicted amidohydrolase